MFNFNVIVLHVLRSLSAFVMDSLLTSDSSVPSQCPIFAPRASTNASSALPSNQSARLPRLYFQAGDNVFLLREVLAVEHPFVHGSTCWEDIAATFQKELPANFQRLLRGLYMNVQQV